VDTPVLQDADGGDARLGAKSVGVVRRTSSNKPFSDWGRVLRRDDVVAAAMIDRLVHHAEILALKGDSYRLKDRDLARPPAD